MTKTDMGINVKDARTKITPELHARFESIATAMGKDSASILRGLILDFCAAKDREYTLAGRLRLGEGLGRDSRGTHK